jgi:hypothetical protein
LLEVTAVVLLALHLLSVNVASAGPLVCLWLEWKERRLDLLATETARRLAWWSLAALLVGGALGLLLGWLHWSPDYARLWTDTLRYKAEWAVGEYVFSLALAIAYVLWRMRIKRPEQATLGGRVVRSLLLFLNGTNLLYHFPFLFTVAVNVDLAPGEVEPIYAAEFRRWMSSADVVARVTHVVIASFAVTGTLLIGFALRLYRRSDRTDDAHRLARWGAWWALLPSLLQIPVGLGVIASLPLEWQNRVLGGDVASVLLLGTSVLLSLFLLQDLASLAIGEPERRLMVRSIVLMLVIVLLMTAVLRRMRPERAGEIAWPVAPASLLSERS